MSYAARSDAGSTASAEVVFLVAAQDAAAEQDPLP
jgi:hypothetical protein